MSEVTRILGKIDDGDPHAAQQLLPLVYDELREIAAAQMAREKPGQTLDATALVHEASLRLIGDQAFANRRHFFAAAAEAMRRILVENARRKARVKHGGGRRRIELDEHLAALPAASDDLLALDEALSRLEARDPRRAEVVKLRFFGGLSMPEVAEQLGVSLATAERHWAFARVWLYTELTGQHGENSSES
ncbi:MAG: sigma-70 family RNA polymerase sigma factor [Planctomycetia bacterium]|nr:sigma-70 family RNA polymerase sigma factor [Planctomycetia bacterium]